MTGRYTEIDCRDKVVDLLENGGTTGQGVSVSSFNTMLGTIETERSLSNSIPTAKSITYKWGMNQYPFILVDLDKSEGITDAYTLDMSYVNLPENYTILVMGFLKYANDEIWNYCEYWIEGIKRVLHNYNSDNISWIAYVSTERAEIYDNQNQRLKSFVVEFEMRCN